MLVKEATGYLAQRPEPLTVTLSPDAPAVTPGSGGQRRVSMGTVPDFGFQGPGVRVEDVVPGSAAETAGIVAGDVVTGVDGQAIDNLQGFTDLLKTLSPGDTVKTTIMRDGKSETLDVTLKAR